MLNNYYKLRKLLGLKALRKPRKPLSFSVSKSISNYHNSNNTNLLNCYVNYDCNIVEREEKQDKRVDNSKGILNKGTEP